MPDNKARAFPLVKLTSIQGLRFAQKKSNTFDVQENIF